MDEHELFPARSSRPRPRRKRAAAPPPVWTAVESPWDEAIRHDRELRGTGRAREIAFRETLARFAEDYAPLLPPLLYEAINDHLTRTDRQGLPLCFNGPLRQALLADVAQWLCAAPQPEAWAARVRWEALTAHQQEVP